MRSQTTVPLIFLPGPVTAAYTVTLASSSHTLAGEAVSIKQSFLGTGRPTEVEDYLNANYRAWHPFCGEEITIDYGKGPIRRVLVEKWGVYSLEQ